MSFYKIDLEIVLILLLDKAKLDDYKDFVYYKFSKINIIIRIINTKIDLCNNNVRVLLFERLKEYN